MPRPSWSNWFHETEVVPALNANPLVFIGFVAAAVTFPKVKICGGFVAARTWVEFWQHGFV